MLAVTLGDPEGTSPPWELAIRHDGDLGALLVCGAVFAVCALAYAVKDFRQAAAEETGDTVGWSLGVTVPPAGRRGGRLVCGFHRGRAGFALDWAAGRSPRVTGFTQDDPRMAEELPRIRE
jgi:hypothetical protein